MTEWWVVDVRSGEDEASDSLQDKENKEYRDRRTRDRVMAQVGAYIAAD